MRLFIGSWHFPQIGGPTTAILSYTKELKSRGWQLGVISPARRKFMEEHFPLASSFIVRVFSRIFKIETRAFSAFKAKRKMNHLAEEFSPNVYWSHAAVPLPDPFEKKMLKSNKGKVLTIHSFYDELAQVYVRTFFGRSREGIPEEGYTPGFIEKKAVSLAVKKQKKLIEKVDAIIVPSAPVKERIKEHNPKNKPVYVIPTGVYKPEQLYTKKEVCREFNIPENSKIFLYVGRVAPEKNISFMIDSLAWASEEEDNVYLLIIGPEKVKNYTKKLKKRIREKGMEKQAIFGGKKGWPEILKYYGGADAFVFASYTETQGIVIWEAMISNLPVVTVRLPVEKEVYPPGTAFVVDRERGVAGFAQTMLEALNNEEKRQKTIENARNFVEDYTIDKTTKQVEEVLQYAANK